MTKAIARDPIYLHRRFQPEIIEQCVRWYLTYRLSYRRYAHKYKTLALGTYPVVTLEWARSGHEFARNLLTHGVDPSALKAALGKQTFAATMREWEIARCHMTALPLTCPVDFWTT
jgi:hypothetical protein